jgi:DNA-binding response OmpR family regulator
MRVLIIDDERIPTAWLKRALVEVGHKVQVRFNATTAMPHLKGPVPPDLVVVKAELPDVPGDQLVHDLRNIATAAHVAVLLLTNSTPEGELETLREQTGADGVLRAPCKTPQVLDWIAANPQLFERPAGSLPPKPSAPPRPPETWSVPPPRPKSRLQLQVEAEVAPKPGVLLVDDEPLALAILEDVLEGQGYRLDRAKDWGSFRAALMEGEYAVIVLDVHLPGLSGDKLAMFASDFLEPPLPRILLHSGMEEPELAELTRNIGADGYLCKGCDEQVIREAVSGAALGYRKARSIARATAQRA